MTLDDGRTISMQTRLRFILVSLVSMLVLLGSSLSAAAAPATQVSGTFTMTSVTFSNVRVVGGNTMIDLHATIAYTGTFTGTSVVDGHLIIHADGRANFRDVETFIGTVNGVPGTVTWNLTGGGQAPAYHGTQVITDATGDLAGLHGLLRQVGQVLDPLAGPFGTYTGEIH
jgi:hypothetical protein